MNRRTEWVDAQEQVARSRRLLEMAERRNGAAILAGLREPFDSGRMEQLQQMLTQACEQLDELRAARPLHAVLV